MAFTLPEILFSVHLKMMMPDLPVDFLSTELCIQCEASKKRLPAGSPKQSIWIYNKYYIYAITPPFIG
jgi:hypothetical protein